MNTITAIAIDDEPLALNLIAEYCQRHGHIQLLTYSEPHIGAKAIRNKQPDIVFLDIEMADITGLQIAAALPQHTQCIFTTAYTQYAIDGFDLNATDYLHKPFTYERFTRAVDRALKLIRRPADDLDQQTINIKSEYETIPIRLSHITHIAAVGSYVKIHLTNGQRILSRMTLKEISSLLPPAHFFRIHRSYIIASNKIKTTGKNTLTLHNGKELPIGRTYGGKLRKLQTTDKR